MTADELTAKLPHKIAERVRSVRLNEGVVTVVADASGLARDSAAALQHDIETLVGSQPGVGQVRVALMADKVKRRIVAVGSGKGGVGKSTLSANLAVALARAGRKVGIVDADIYGPSQPVLLGVAEAQPTADGQTLNPIATAFGVRMLSMGQMIPPGKAIAWRGPMIGKALSQLMDAAWGDAEVLLVDLPPGTGDVQLTMLQKFKPDGAIIVSTPQDLALIDATRALDLFRQAQVPVIGLVENMAGYACPACGEISNPFGEGGVEAAARALDEPFLGRVPLALEIRQASDAGTPPAAGDDAHGEAFRAIAGRLVEWLDRTSA
ncbi:MAG: Mrp/NBP35 family ATP-binding protein [Croceibacterium sp.]